MGKGLGLVCTPRWGTQWMTSAGSPASSESVSRTDNPSKIIKLDTVRVIAERVSTGTEGSPSGAAVRCRLLRVSGPHP